MNFDNYLSSQNKSLKAISSKINKIYLPDVYPSVKPFENSIDKLTSDIINSISPTLVRLNKINEQTLKSLTNLNKINEQNLKNLTKFNKIFSDDIKQFQTNIDTFVNSLNKKLIIKSLNLLSENIFDVSSSILINEEILETQSEINEITNTLSNTPWC